MTTRREFLAGAAAASVSAPSVALASNSDAALLAAVAEYHRFNDDLECLTAEVDIAACRERNKATAFRIAALPALTMAGIMAKTRIALEAITSGESEWDEAIAEGLLEDMDRFAA